MVREGGTSCKGCLVGSFSPNGGLYWVVQANKMAAMVLESMAEKVAPPVSETADLLSLLSANM